MRQLIYFTVLTFCILSASCTKTAVPVDLATCCKVENEKKYVEVSGYLDDGGFMSCSGRDGRVQCGMNLAETPKAKGLSVYVEEGDGANKISKINGSYKRDELKIHDNSGNVISLNDKVKVTGEMNVMPDGSFCFLEISKIEK